MKTFILMAVTMLLTCNAFSPLLNPRHAARFQVSLATRQQINIILSQSSEDNEEEGKADTKKSLEEKMRGWEATDEEKKAATLGGIIPRERTDAFDVGLYIAFPIMVAGGLLVAFFPLLIGYIDVSSVGPPPTS
jgi:hypothetical protein